MIDSIHTWTKICAKHAPKPTLLGTHFLERLLLPRFALLSKQSCTCRPPLLDPPFVDALSHRSLALRHVRRATLKSNNIQLCLLRNNKIAQTAQFKLFSSFDVDIDVDSSHKKQNQITICPSTSALSAFYLPTFPSSSFYLALCHRNSCHQNSLLLLDASWRST